MPTAAELDLRLDGLSREVDRWTRDFFERRRPSAERFAGLLGYPLGWVDEQLTVLDPPAPAGKRLRPALCLLVCEVAGADYGAALAPAAALELIHNFSLVHDDIQDESPLRRGRATVWAGWGTAQAINVGDSLFALAQLALLDGAAPSAEVQVEAARCVNLTCLRLVEGQYRDLELQEAGTATLEAYQTMVLGKTAALLEACCWLGARFGGLDEAGAERFARFGRELGLAFQFQDDLLGIWGDPAETGKSAETDLLTRKQALPAVLALQSDGPAAERFRSIFLAAGPMRPADAASALALLNQLDVRRQAEAMVTAGYARAAEALDAALAGGDGGYLRALLDRFERRST